MKMVVIHVHEHIFNSECQNPRQNLFRTITEDSKAKKRHSWILLDRPPPIRPGGQAIWSDCLITIPIPALLTLAGGGGGAIRKGGGFSS